MLRKDHFLLTAIAVLCLQTASAQENYRTSSHQSSAELRYRSQGYDVIDSAYIPAGRMKQHREFLAHNYAFPAKPRNMWELGVGAGLYNILGDVPGLAPWQKGGYGIHAHLRKAWGYVISNRIQYNYGIAKGLQWQESRNYLYNPAWTMNYNAAGNRGDAPIDAIHYNYRMESHQLNLDVIATANNIRFHKARSNWLVYGFIGVGGLAYKTYVNTMNGDQAYQYCDMVTVPQIHENKDEILKSLQDGMDDSYETAAESHAGRRKAEFGKRGLGGVGKTLQFVPSVGGGIQIRLARHVNLSLEDRLTIPYDDDLIDGQRWGEQPFGSPAETQHKDVINYLGLGLNFNIGNSRRSIEPLYWVNPMVYAYSQLSTGDRIPMPEMELPDADFDGITDQFDLCPGTPAGVAVDMHGCPLDTDGDGVPDFRDKQLITPTECQPVDVDGIGKCPCPEGCEITPAGTACVNIVPGAVSFRQGSAELSNHARRQLDVLAEQLKSEPGCNVLLSTYPKPGPHNGNSERRARQRIDNTIEYLKNEGGIDASRIKWKYDEYMDRESDMVEYEPNINDEGRPAVNY